MGLFSRIFEGRREREAKRLTEAGEFSRAADLFLSLGNKDEAARCLLLAEATETDERARLRLLARAIELSSEGEQKTVALTRRALFVLARAEGGPVLSPLLRNDLAVAATHLLTTDSRAATRAYRLLGDVEGVARALEAGGEIEELEAHLSKDVATMKRGQEERAAIDEAELLEKSGRRKEALAHLKTLASSAVAKSAARRIEQRRPDLHALQVRIDGRAVHLLIDASVVVGRTEGLVVPSPEVSRAHVRLTLENGELVVEDLGSRNGTKIRGSRIEGRFVTTDAVLLELGAHVTLQIERGAHGWEIAHGATRHLATFGPLVLGDVHVESREDWLVAYGREGSLRDVCLSGLEVSGEVELLVGDTIRGLRGHAMPSFELLEPPMQEKT